MIEAPHFSAAGASKKAVTLPAALFDGKVNEDVLHRAVITYLSNQRQGTHDTKTRAEVSGGNQKPWRQKGTGRARQGSTRAPHWRHGGIVFGPHPRSYRLGIPKKMRQLAKKSALNARAREGALVVVDALEYEKPKTKDFVTLLGKLGAKPRYADMNTAYPRSDMYWHKPSPLRSAPKPLKPACWYIRIGNRPSSFGRQINPAISRPSLM